MQEWLNLSEYRVHSLKIGNADGIDDMNVNLWNKFQLWKYNYGMSCKFVSHGHAAILGPTQNVFFFFFGQ
jgi:hypothetical protein